MRLLRLKYLWESCSKCNIVHFFNYLMVSVLTYLSEIYLNIHILLEIIKSTDGFSIITNIYWFYCSLNSKTVHATKYAKYRIVITIISRHGLYNWELQIFPTLWAISMANFNKQNAIAIITVIIIGVDIDYFSIWANRQSLWLFVISACVYICATFILISFIQWISLDMLSCFLCHLDMLMLILSLKYDKFISINIK